MLSGSSDRVDQYEAYILDFQDSASGGKRVVLTPEIDYFHEAASLFIRFDNRDEEVLVGDAKVIIGINKGGISSIEILIRDKKMAERLSRILRGEDSDK